MFHVQRLLFTTADLGVSSELAAADELALNVEEGNNMVDGRWKRDVAERKKYAEIDIEIPSHSWCF